MQQCIWNTHLLTDMIYSHTTLTSTYNIHTCVCRFHSMYMPIQGFPGGSLGKESVCSCRFSPWVRKIPGGGHGNPLQYSCLENPVDRGAWRVTVHKDVKSRTRLK